MWILISQTPAWRRVPFLRGEGSEKSRAFGNDVTASKSVFGPSTVTNSKRLSEASELSRMPAPLQLAGVLISGNGSCSWQPTWYVVQPKLSWNSIEYGEDMHYKPMSLSYFMSFSTRYVSWNIGKLVNNNNKKPVFKYNLKGWLRLSVKLLVFLSGEVKNTQSTSQICKRCNTNYSITDLTMLIFWRVGRVLKLAIRRDIIRLKYWGVIIWVFPFPVDMWAYHSHLRDGNEQKTLCLELCLLPTFSQSTCPPCHS